MALTTLPVEFGSAKILANLSTAVLVEMALARGEGQLAANGALLTVAVAFVWNNVAGFIGK